MGAMLLNFVLYATSRWKLLDFALLKCNSVSFFDVQKPESALSRWSRARMRAAKVNSCVYRLCYLTIILSLELRIYSAVVCLVLWTYYTGSWHYCDPFFDKLRK